jgi:hypothetical protein
VRDAGFLVDDVIDKAGILVCEAILILRVLPIVAGSSLRFLALLRWLGGSRGWKIQVMEITKTCDPGPCISGRIVMVLDAGNCLILGKLCNFDQISGLRFFILNLVSAHAFAHVLEAPTHNGALHER